MKAIIAIIAIVILGAGVSVAANRSLPGNALYGVKINVNEKVRLALAASDQAKAKLEAEFAQNRLEEATQVATDGQLSSDVEATIENNFADFSARVKDRVTAFEDRDLENASDITTNFQTALDAHAEILAELAAKSDQAEGTELVKLSTKVKSESDEMDKLETEIEAKLAAQPNVKAAAEGKMKAALNKINEATRFIDNAQAKLGAAATAQARARLSFAQQKFTDGQAKLQAQAYAEAFAFFTDALRNAQTAQQLAALQLGVSGEAGDENEAGINENNNEVENEVKVEGGINANVNTNSNSEQENTNGALNLNLNLNR